MPSENSEPKLISFNYGTITSFNTKKVSTIDLPDDERLSFDRSSIHDESKPNYAHFQKTLQDGDTTFWSKSMQEKVSLIQERTYTVVRNITVEPCLLLVLISAGMSAVVAQNLVLAKYCMTYFSYSEEVCEALSKNETLENQVQTKATNFQMYKTFVETFPTMIIALFMGPWSDKYGRKVLLMMPCIGGFLNMVIYIINVYYMRELQPVYLLLAEIPNGLTGGKAAMSLGAFSYIIDTSTVQSRTIRIAILQAAMLCGAPIGLTVGGTVYAQFGYVPVFAAAAVINLFCFAYVLFVVKESIIIETKTSLTAKICSFFDLTKIKEGFQACLRKREMNHRVHIICLVIAMMINIIPIMAEFTVGYYYVRTKFHWDVDDYSYYSTTMLACYTIGLLFFLPLFTKLKISEVYIGIIGACAKVCSEMVMAFARQGWIVYAASPILVFAGLNSPIVRSMLSKCTSIDEQGKVMSVVAAMEAGMPLIGSTVYTQVLNATRTTFPGTIYFISSVLCVIPVVLFVWIYKDIQKHEKKAAGAALEETLNSDTKIDDKSLAVHL